jgi:hypothetical protein
MNETFLIALGTYIQVVNDYVLNSEIQVEYTLRACFCSGVDFDSVRSVIVFKILRKISTTNLVSQLT